MKRIALALLFALFPAWAHAQAVNWGDYQDSNQTIYLYFNTLGTTGEAAALSSGNFDIYEDGSTTQIATADSLTASFDSVTGLNVVAVDLNDAGFETGKTYTVVLSAGTVGSLSVVGRVVGVFSVGRYASTTDIWNTPSTEPTSPPGSTAGRGAKIDWLFLIARNRKRVTQSLIEWFAEDASTVVGEAVLDPNSNTEVNQAEAGAP